jgi:hypothetical protein
MRRIFQIFFVLTLVVLASGAQAQSNVIIYSNSLQNGFANWSWSSTIDFSATSPVRTGDSDSISVTSQGYAALYLNANGTTELNGSQYTNLALWLNGGASGGQVLSVDAILGTANQSATVKVGPLAANTWTQYTISTAALGVANATGLTGFWFQNTSGSAIPTYYVADIELIAGPAASPGAPNPTNFISIDVGANRHPISPMIYGTAFATSNQLADLGFTMNRSGGNEETTYNWEINAHGKGNDYFFESLPDSSATPGQSADSVVADAKGAGAHALITIPMIGWTPILGPSRGKLASFSIAKYGPQVTNDPYFLDAGNGVSVTNNMLITWNDKTDAYKAVDTNYQKAYVQHLTNTWGVSANGGVGFYLMDNEQSLWSSTHQDIHPVGPTMQEILGDIIAYASMVKSVDSNAVVGAPEEWGWNGYLYSGYDQQWSGQKGDYNRNDYPDRKTNGGWDYGPWLLNQLKQYETAHGQRLLDYFTLHCYPQEVAGANKVSGDAADMATALLRNQSTRQFWDTNYVDPSWINSVVMLIPRMSNWVATYYPGTKIGITEYNWGAQANINGATAQADVLGIFGREGVDLATRWTTPPATTPTYLAMKMYRNYDSHGHTFGDTSVLAGGPNPDNVAVFAAQRSADRALTIMVVNKYLTGTTPIVINLTNFAATGTAQAWQLNSSNVIAQLPNVPYSAGLLKTTVPSPSVTLIVLTSAPTLNLHAGLQGAAGQFQLLVTADLGSSVAVESSTDLAHWSPISTNIVSTTEQIISVSAGSSAEFYRAVLR